MTSRSAASARAGLFLILVAVVVAPLIGMLLWSDPGSATFWRALGKANALALVPLMVLQIVMASRLRRVDRVFGHDIVMQFHRNSGILAVALAVAHPVFLCVDDGSLWLLSWGVGWRIWLGKLALLALVVAAVVMRTGRLDYLRRRAVHGFAAVLAALLALSHGYTVGTALEIVHLRLFWWGLLVVVVMLFIYRNAIVPRRRAVAYSVTAVTRETHDTWTVRLAPANGRVVHHLPGQFMFAFITAGERREEHPFTIASAPHEGGCIEATIKESGDFTRTIGATAVGSRVTVEAPFGQFGACLHEATAFVFIAGGVGITPVMSMLRHLRDANDARRIALLYGNKTEADIIFREELAQMPSHVKVTHVLSNPSGEWAGPTGYVTAEIIRSHAGDLVGAAEVYLCGPPVMMVNVLAALRGLGVAWKRIHYERFAL